METNKTTMKTSASLITSNKILETNKIVSEIKANTVTTINKIEIVIIFIRGLPLNIDFHIFYFNYLIVNRFMVIVIQNCSFFKLNVE